MCYVLSYRSKKVSLQCCQQIINHILIDIFRLFKLEFKRLFSFYFAAVFNYRKKKQCYWRNINQTQSNRGLISIHRLRERLCTMQHVRFNFTRTVLNYPWHRSGFSHSLSNPASGQLGQTSFHKNSQNHDVLSLL